MNKIACLLIILQFFVGCKARSTPIPDCSLRYDGMYGGRETYQDKEICRTFLRFYPDGTVITVSTAYYSEDGQSTLIDMKKWFSWFSKESPSVTLGQYTIKGNCLSFNAVWNDGSADYTGEIHGDQIYLRCYGHVTQKWSTDAYEFMKW